VDDHHVDRVPDDVVELVGDPAPLLLEGQARLVGLGQPPGQVALGPQLDLLQATRAGSAAQAWRLVPWAAIE
jgi:hypothetical protein